MGKKAVKKKHSSMKQYSNKEIIRVFDKMDLATKDKRARFLIESSDQEKRNKQSVNIRWQTSSSYSLGEE